MESVDPDPEIAALTHFWCPPAALLYRREIVERIGSWSKDLPIIQDARFLMDAALQRARFAHVPGVGAYYRVHGHSLSRANASAFLRDCLENAVQVEEFWRQNGGLTDERANAVLQVLSYVTRATFKTDHETFCRALSFARRIRPGWFPKGSRSFRLLSSVVGYPRSESGALAYRSLKRLLCGLNLSARTSD
ncbi:MAG: hypothetical protein AUI36_42865 [Cyanobacteria bacterium 13_1_40CM_2_61_4]|nr:MAG: hypothetical protein AUI36_42865 [Cyanobacteria bacterium 13_1_40CM_2_61_4]